MNSDTDLPYQLDTLQQPPLMKKKSNLSWIGFFIKLIIVHLLFGWVLAAFGSPLTLGFTLVMSPFLLALAIGDFITVMSYINKQAPPRSPLNRSFFSNLNKMDLIISAIFASFTLALSLLICSRIWAEMHISSWILVFLLSLDLLESIGRGFVIGFGPVGGLLAIISLFIIPFIFRLIIFYSLAQFSKKVFGQKDTFLLHHLPSLFVFLIFYGFIVFFIVPACQLQP